MFRVHAAEVARFRDAGRGKWQALKSQPPRTILVAGQSSLGQLQLFVDDEREEVETASPEDAPMHH